MDKSKRKQILSNWAIKKEEQTFNDDIRMGLNEDTIKVGCIIEAWVAPQVVCVLPPIYEGLKVHSQKLMCSNLICIIISMVLIS